MPHSLIAEDDSALNEDVSPQIQIDNGETQVTEGTLTAETEEQNGATQATDSTDQDMTMADIGKAEEDLPSKDLIKEETKPEVKLEDLFADMESDDEFPSSAAPEMKVDSSPEAPASPV